MAFDWKGFSSSGISKLFILVGIIGILCAVLLALFMLSTAFSYLWRMGNGEPISIMDAIIPGIMGLVILALFFYVISRAYFSQQISIKLEKNEYIPGEEIKGTISLKLSRPVEARGLKASFFGRLSEGKVVRTVCKAECNVANKRTFNNGETFDFALKVPNEAIDHLGDGEGAFSIRWEVEAALDLPGKVDIANYEHITLSLPITENIGQK